METLQPKKEQGRTKAKKKLFLAIFSMNLGCVTKACKHTRIHRDTYYDWRHTDPKFAVAARLACEESIEYFINQKDNWF